MRHAINPGDKTMPPTKAANRFTVKDSRDFKDGCAPFMADDPAEYGCDAPNIRAWLVELPNGVDAWFTTSEDANHFIEDYGALLAAVDSKIRTGTPH
jgi:hypothetical protein